MSDAPAPSPAWFRDPAAVRRVFVVVAFAEAFSWIGLLIGVYFKRVAETSELGVQIFGPIHGAIFVAYVALSILTAVRFGWSRTVLAVALICSIPPFASVVFELVAARRGLLTVPDASTDATPDAARPQPR